MKRSCRLIAAIVLSCVLAFSATQVDVPDTRAADTRTWTLLPLYGTMVTDLAVSPMAPATVYAACYNGIFRSTDAGSHWQATAPVTEFGSLVAETSSIWALAIDPATPTTVYAGCSFGILRSTDAGDHWEDISTGLNGIVILSLAINPRTPTTLYAAALAGGIFQSTDAGDHWKEIKSGMFASVAVDPTTSANVYAVDFFGTVFRSTDAGEHWQEATTSLTAGFSSLVINPEAPGTIYAGTMSGVFRSTDAGDHWEEVTKDLASLSIHVLAMDPAASATLYFGAASGVFRSTDAGDHWKKMSSDDLSSNPILALAVDPATPASLYLGTRSDVCRSTDAGVTSQKIVNGMTPRIDTIIVDPKTPATVYAGGRTSGVFRSTDAGATWQQASEGLTETLVFSLAIDPVTPATLYAGTTSSVFRSTDAGDHWKQVASGLTGKTVSAVADSAEEYVSALAVNPKAPATVYAGTNDSGVFRSTDAGDHWKQVTSGLTDKNVSSLAIDPVTPATLYAGTTSGVFRSTDAGEHWKQLLGGLSPTPILFLGVDPQHAATVYAGTLAGVLRSTDAGDHWEPASEDLAEVSVLSLTFDPVTPATLYAGTDSGAFQSTDAGDHWERLAGGLSSTPVLSLAVDPQHAATMYAGTLFGVFRYDPAWTLSVTPTPADGGSVTKSPDQPSYASGTTVTLTAVPAPGWRIAGWTGAESTAADPLGAVVVMDADKTVTVTFEPIIAAPTAVMLSSPADGATVDTSTVILSWQPATGATSYTIALDTSSGFTSPVTWNTATTSQTTGMLSKGSTYYWRVAAVNAGGASPWSPVCSFSARTPQITLTLTLQIGSTTMSSTGSDGSSDTVTLDAAPVLGAGNRTLVPVRAVAEAMGGSVSWDAATRTAAITVGNDTLELTLGKNTAMFNGTPTPIDADSRVLPLVVNGRTMLPLRFVMESLGADVTYDAPTKNITITYIRP
jgi:photosystem II stability/assembly factor-like uncharacterized protein